MLVLLVVVGVVVGALVVLLAAFAITRQAVAAAAAALTAELPAGERVVARASANGVSGAPRGMGALVVTDAALRFRGARAAETLVVDRSTITGATAGREGNRPVLTVSWPEGTATWRTADPTPLAAALAP